MLPAVYDGRTAGRADEVQLPVRFRAVLLHMGKQSPCYEVRFKKERRKAASAELSEYETYSEGTTKRRAFYIIRDYREPFRSAVVLALIPISSRWV